MPKHSIKDIIYDYLSGDYPGDVKLLFERWMVGGESSADKENALKSYWEELDAKADGSTLRKLEALHEQMEPGAQAAVEKLRRPVRTVWWAAAAALVIAAQFFLTDYFTRKPDQVVVVTAEGSKGFYTLPDGSAVWLNESSRLTFTENFDDSRRVVNLDGEAYFKVTKDASKPFEVRLGCMTVEVLGTEFDVMHYDFFDETSTVLSSGSVRITVPSVAEPIILAPDQMFSISKSTGKAAISSVNSSNYSQWMNNSLVFENARLGDVLINLERWYNVDIACPVDFAEQTRISFTVRRETLEEILDAMSLVLRTGYTINGKKVEMKPKNLK